MAAEPHWQKVGNLLRACLEVFFPFGSKTKQSDAKHHSLECYSWSIYQSISNENKTIVLNVSPALNLEN